MIATYTTLLKTLIESGYDIGLKDYPIFNESYRNTLNKKIIEHYYFREIGSETAALFVYRLNRRMSEIMPYYNQLYNTQSLIYDPFLTHEFTEQLETVSSNTGDNTAENNAKSVYSDTPQGLLSIGNIENDIYATNAQIDTTGASSNYSNRGNSTVNKSSRGNNSGRTQSDMLLEYRKTFLNIDMDIINNLEDLFMGLWG